MQWNEEQDAALRAVDEWLRNPQTQVFYLSGYAGTGKTTLARHFAEHVDGMVLFGAFTGKAAYVLQEKGCDGATTIHSMIYHSRDKGQAKLREMEAQLQTLINELKDEDKPESEINAHPRVRDLEKMIRDEKEALKQPFFILNPDSPVKDAALVIIDECSMVDDRMGSDLLSFGTPVLVLGDPAQLPPVGGAGYFTENITPNIMLTEIHRQAKESPILALATEVRTENRLRIGNYGDECRVIDGEKIAPEEALKFDQILVGRNKTRFASNRRIRGLKGIEDKYPVIDDRLVCLRNNHDLGLLNGAIFNVIGITGVMDAKVFMSVTPETGTFAQDVAAHEHHFLGLGEELPWYERKEAEEFDFGYAMTVHKAQGSQWDKVFLCDESFCFKKDRWRWLYTGITRAAKELIVAKM